jgi:hypothetical protein
MLIVADTHNFESLKKILDNFDNLISLGDIQAVDFDELSKNKELYSKCWKAFMNKNFNEISKEDKKWFKELNIEGWKKQIEQIKDSKKNFTLCLGNSDLRMIQFFPECKKILESSEDKKFQVISKPKLVQYNNHQILFIPYSDEKLNVTKLINNLTNKKLFILTHCPCFKEHKKEYYVNNYKMLLEINKIFSGEIYFIHGHVHPEKSFKYCLEEFPNTTFLSIKATESEKGIGVENELLEIESMKLFDLNKKEKNFSKLNKEYLNKEHWNSFN